MTEQREAQFARDVSLREGVVARGEAVGGEEAERLEADRLAAEHGELVSQHR